MLPNRFRWVYCKLEVLRQCHRNDLRRILKEFPPSLDETYQRILKEINGANAKQAHRLLQCLVAAHRPLRVEELAVVLALDVDAGGVPRFNAEWRWEDHEAAVLSTCSSLVSVVNHGGSRVVQFCHFSVKEFLMSDRLSSTEGISQFHISHEPSNAVLTQACLGVLLSEDGPTKGPTSEDSAGGIPLSEYASENWLEHALVGNVELQVKDALDCLFDRDKPHFEALLRREGISRELRSSDKDPKGVLTPAFPFSVAVKLGLRGLAERLVVANPPQVTEFRFHGCTLLHLAVRDEAIEVTRLLLAHGADRNSRPDHPTPRHIASPQRHSEKLLDGSLDEIGKIENSLQKSDAHASSEGSSDDDMRCGEEWGFTPLHLAVSQGHLELSRMLLENEADPRMHDNNGDTPLHLAASGCHLEIIRILLEYNAEVNSRNEDGSTPLLIASSKGDLDILRLLLEHEADAFVHDNSGSTPLHFAVIGGHVEVVRMLLERKAEVNSRNQDGSTPSHIASSKGKLDILRLLLVHGADAFVHDNSGNSPLHFAVIGGHLEVARVLLECKADADALRDKGLTPLHQASQSWWRGDPDIVQLVRLFLDNGENVNVHDKRGNTPLHFAAYEGDLEVARTLLEFKAEVDSLNDDGLTPLQLALEGRREGYPDIMRLLLDHGANVEAHDKGGNTTLHFTASGGDLEVTRMLLEFKAEVNSLNQDRYTPLLMASSKGNLDISRLLLTHGADPFVHDNNGSTPLHLATIGRHFEVARSLLEYKADVNTLDGGGWTPLHKASQCWWKGDPEIVRLVRLLLDNDANVEVQDKHENTALHFAASEGHLEVVCMLLEFKAEVDSRNQDRSTPLLIASSKGNLEISRLLLTRGADPFVHDNNGSTPLHLATIGRHFEVARSLLEHKADVNALDGGGWTPLHKASQCWWKGDPEIVRLVRLLLDNDANVEVQDKHENTALHFAASEGHLEVTRMLLEFKAEVNSRNRDRSTPLLIASSKGNLDISRLLLTRGADPFVHDNNGSTPLHLATIGRHFEVARSLLEHKADVNALDGGGWTPLHKASQCWWKGDPEIVRLVRLLLDNDVNVNARDKGGNTALHFAASEGHLEVVRMLLEFKAEVNFRNQDGSTPSLIASSKGNLDILQLLLAHSVEE
jgi:ankyrin repeat protein